MIDSSFWDKLRVKEKLDDALDEAFNNAFNLGKVLKLTTKQVEGIITMTVNAKLSQLTKEWKGVEAVTPSFSAVPEGEYVASLKEMKIEESKKSQRLQVVSTYEIVDGDQTGQTVKRFDGLDNPTSMGYFKGLCSIIGLELPADANMWQEGMDEFVAANTDLFDIVVKINDKYSNVYVNGVSEMVLGEEQTEEEAEEEAVEEQVEEEVSEEEVVEEEEQQVLPPKKVAKPVAKPVAKSVAKPVAKPATQLPAKKPIVLKKR